MDREIMDNLKRQFALFDANKDGTISLEELKRVLQQLDAQLWTDAAVGELLAQLDTNANGRIEYEEFLHFVYDNTTDGRFLTAQEEAKVSPTALQAESPSPLAQMNAAQELDLFIRSGYKLDRDGIVMCRQGFHETVRKANRKCTKEEIDGLFDSMLYYNYEVFRSGGIYDYIREEHFKQWASEQEDEGGFFTVEEVSAVEAVLAAEQAAVDAQQAVWAEERAKEQAVKDVAIVARKAKADAALKMMEGLAADETLADETVGNEVAKLVWHGFSEGDGPMADEPDTRWNKYGFKDDWSQGRAEINQGRVCLSERDCSGVSARAFFLTVRKGDDFGFAVGGKSYHGKVAMAPGLGNYVTLEIDAGYPEATACSKVQIIRHATNVVPATARNCKFYQNLEPAESIIFAGGNVCASCGVLRGDHKHNVCGQFVVGVAEGFRDGRHRAFCATCGMPDDFHKACAEFVPGGPETKDRWGHETYFCKRCHKTAYEHGDVKR